MSSGIAVWCMGLVCVGVMWLVSHVYHLLIDVYEQSAALSDIEYSWFFKLLLNLVGYSTVLLPMFIMYKYLEKINYFDKISNAGRTWRVLFTCFGEPGERLPDAAKVRKDESPTREGAQLAFCFIGLMSSYLVWGLLQEKIMTQVYVMSDGSTLRFSDSQFLVFVNRLAALAAAGARLACSRAALAPVPLYKFSYCSLTNVVSAWCQYEALKYVSFPTQVLSKSCKVIPVMLMGKLVSRNKYEVYEYVTAVLISVGMIMFMFGSHDTNMVSSAMTWGGAALLGVYMVCDAFTSSWQGAVFARYQCSALHMLCAVNAFSCALTAAAHAHHAPPLQLLQHPMFLADCIVLSLSSAIGQLLIYHTIARFGAVVFTIIMTLRQAVSILLSCVVYGHRVSVGGALGVCVVLGAVLLRLYARARMRTRRRAAHL
ncbi:adenosine 3'-phospho 5'-phosphosulfate transporter 1 [Spodoptera frugiperda]|uniref:Adenosine 3'-phospho 5'-phosphosulfate transporter 1 n=1 Tax=Spodoptera frugiperda TaxID=7108 RepID=A0A9R0DH42_SPOFR|nr:adenosine 3'-phospho 5'-phosphosulfate transporter 1 [Spodoptera frugiperda]